MGSMRVLVTPRPFDSKGQEHLQHLRDAGYEVEWNDTGKRAIPARILKTASVTSMRC